MTISAPIFLTWRSSVIHIPIYSQQFSYLNVVCISFSGILSGQKFYTFYKYFYINGREYKQCVACLYVLWLYLLWSFLEILEQQVSLCYKLTCWSLEYFTLLIQYEFLECISGIFCIMRLSRNKVLVCKPFSFELFCAVISVKMIEVIFLIGFHQVFSLLSNKY